MPKKVTIERSDISRLARAARRKARRKPMPDTPDWNDWDSSCDAVNQQLEGDSEMKEVDDGHLIDSLMTVQFALHKQIKLLETQLVKATLPTDIDALLKQRDETIIDQGKHISALEKQRNEARTERDTLQEAHTGLQDACAEHIAEIAALKAENQSLTEREMEATAESERRNHQLARALLEQEDLREDVSKHIMELTNACATLEKSQETNTELEKQNSLLAKQNKQLVANNGELVEQRDAYKGDYEDVLECNSKLARERDEARGKSDDVSHSNVELGQQLKTAEHERDEANAGWEKAVGKAEAENGALLRERDSWKGKALRYKQQRDIARANIKALQQAQDSDVAQSE